MSDKETGVEVDLDEYKNEQKEYAEALDEIFAAEEGESDDEINKRLDEKQVKDETSGEVTRDPEPVIDKPVEDPTPGSSDEDSTKGQGGLGDPDKVPATDKVEDNVDWKARAEAAEASLAKEKQKTSSWAGRIKKANDDKAELEAKLNAIPSEDDISDQAKIDKFREDFPELGDVVDVMERKISKVAPVVPKADVEPEADPTLAPEAGDPVDDNEKPSDHYTETRKAHADLDEIVNSGVLLTWINSQKDYIQPHLRAVYQGGSAKQIIDMVGEFKSTSGWKSQLGNPNGKKEDKLKSMLAADGSESPGPIDRNAGPAKDDFLGTAKAIGL